MITRVHVLTDSGVWVKHPRLFAIHRIVARGAGGGGSWPTGSGNGHGGGGGGASYTKRAIGEWELPDSVDYEVGVAGSGGNESKRSGGNGGDTWFGDFIRVGGGQGASTTTRGLGGFGMYRGGNGGQSGQPGESISSGPVDFSAGGGGGAGAGGFLGGASGYVPGGASYPALWQTSQSGGGGSTGNAGGFPAGGGGGGKDPNFAGGKGAGGLLTIIEYILEE